MDSQSLNNAFNYVRNVWLRSDCLRMGSELRFADHFKLIIPVFQWQARPKRRETKITSYLWLYLCYSEPTVSPHTTQVYKQREEIILGFRRILSPSPEFVVLSVVRHFNRCLSFIAKSLCKPLIQLNFSILLSIYCRNSLSVMQLISYTNIH